MTSPTSDFAPAAGVHWRGADPADLDWASWGESHVLFHRPSGKTHLVNSTTFLLLTELIRAPCDLYQIADALADDPPDGDPRDRLDEILQLILRLEDLGLVSVA